MECCICVITRRLNWQTLDCHFTATQNGCLFLLMSNLWYKSTICKPGQWSRVSQSCIHMPSPSVQQSAMWTQGSLGGRTRMHASQPGWLSTHVRNSGPQTDRKTSTVSKKIYTWCLKTRCQYTAQPQMNKCAFNRCLKCMYSHTYTRSAISE